MAGRLLRVLVAVLILTQVSSAQRGSMLGGGGNPYTLSFLVDSGNGLDPALDTSALPNIPRSWRGEALAIVIGATNGMALRGLTDLHNKTGYRSRFDFYLAAESTSNDTFCSIAVGKAISTLEFYDADTPIAFYIDLYKNASGVLKFRTRIPTEKGTELITTWSGTVNLQQVYRFDNTYDITNENYTLEIDGDTVIDRDFDKGSITSIDTLVLGSSGGSTCRNVTYLIGRVLENPLGAAPFTVPPPAVAPSAPVISSDSPANGATSVPTAGQSLGCSSLGALTYDMYFGTVTPPVTRVVTGASTCGYVIPSLANATTYYWRVNPSNATGITAGPIWSFTTLAAPTNGDLDLIAAKANCASSGDNSPTGRNPNLLWTCEWQNTWNQTVSEYESACGVGSADALAAACTAIPATRAARWLKNIRAVALSVPDGTGDNAAYSALMYQATGDATYITHATFGMYKKLTANFIGTACPTNADVPRITQGIRTLMLEWAWPALTEAQRLAFVGQLDKQNDCSWWNYGAGAPRWDDPDQIAGQLYFPMAMMKVILPNNLSNNAIFTDPEFGGFDATDCTTGPPPIIPPASKANMRNAICHLIQVLSAGGNYLEGPMYEKETIPFWIGMAKAISNARGVDTYPEVTTWLADHVSEQIGTYTPDLRKQVQFADEQDPDILLVFRNADHMRAVAGYLQGTASGQKMNDLLADFVAVHGETATQPGSLKWWGTFLYNGYDSVGDWQTAKYWYGSALGTQYLKSGFTSSDSLYFINCNQQPTLTNEYGSYLHDHRIMLHCAPQIYSNGEWIASLIGSYAGVSAHAEGYNAMRFNGFGHAQEYSQVRQKSLADTHAFIRSTTGGARSPKYTDGRLTWEPPPVMLNEHTRGALWIPAQKVLIIHDRASVDDIVDGSTDMSRYAVGCGALFQGRSMITQAHAKQEWLWHMPVDPTVASNVFTWTTPVTSQSVKLTNLLPSVATRTVYDLATTFAQNISPFTGSPRCGWSQTQILPPHAPSAGYPYYEADGGGYDRKLLKIWPTTMGTFHTYLNVVQIGASAITPTTMSNGDAECAHVVTTGQNDILACFNGQTSTVLSNTNYDIAHKAILDSAALFDAGARTISVTTVAGTLEMHLADLNPALSWTYNIDGAGAVTINAAGLTTTGGYARIVVSLSAGAHSIVITGS